jgi:hypothetical protein
MAYFLWESNRNVNFGLLTDADQSEVYAPEQSFNDVGQKSASRKYEVQPALPDQLP